MNEQGTRTLTEAEHKILVEQLEVSSSFVEKFFHFKMNTQVQLLSSMLQYFQSLGSITLAVVSILLGTGFIKFSFWWLSMGGCALALVIYTSANTREIVDLKARELNEAERSLNDKHAGTIAAVEAAMKARDFSIYQSYREAERKDEMEPPESFDGEIVMFLFLMTLLLGLCAAIDANQSISGLRAVGLVVSGTILCLIIAIEEWCRPLTGLISVAGRKIKPTTGVRNST